MNASVWLKPLEGHPIVNSSAKNALSQNLFALDTLKSLKTGTVTAGHVNTCMESISQGSNIECRRFRILLSISDQDSAYEKMGKHISQALADYLENDTGFLFPFYHTQDIGHQVKMLRLHLNVEHI